MLEVGVARLAVNPVEKRYDLADEDAAQGHRLFERDLLVEVLTQFT